MPIVNSSETRDPAYWPFNARSPWNIPIGSRAKYEAVSSPNWHKALQYGFLVNSTEWTIPVFVARPSDSIRKIYRKYDANSGYLAFKMRVPKIAKPDSAGDAHLHIIDETHSFVIEMLNASRLANGDIEAPFPNKINLRGSGISKKYMGSCAYGGSCTAGLIRKGELKTGIRHALRMSITTDVLNKNAPGGKPYVWPANTADNDYQTSYANTGNVYIGSLLAIPPDVNIKKIATPGTPLYELAKALQDYGAYVVDRGHLNLYVEPQAQNEAVTLHYNRLGKYLKVVKNNGPNRIGGGGKRRRPLAPKFKSITRIMKQ